MSVSGFSLCSPSSPETASSKRRVCGVFDQNRRRQRLPLWEFPSWVASRRQFSHSELSEWPTSRLFGSGGANLYLSARFATPRRERWTLLLTADGCAQWCAASVHLILWCNQSQLQMNAALSGFPAWYLGESEERRWLAGAIVWPRRRLCLQNDEFAWKQGKGSVLKTTTCFFTEVRLPIWHGPICMMDEPASAARAAAQPVYVSPEIILVGWRRKYYCASAKQLFPVDCTGRKTKRLFIGGPRQLPLKYFGLYHVCRLQLR